MKALLGAFINEMAQVGGFLNEMPLVGDFSEYCEYCCTSMSQWETSNVLDHSALRTTEHGTELDTEVRTLG